LIARRAMLAVLVVLGGCAANPEQRFVRSVHAIAPSVVLFTMHVAPEKKSDGYDDAYGTGTIVASGPWGSDILTAAHVVAGAWDLHATLAPSRTFPARVIAANDDTDVALLRTSTPNLPAVRLLPQGDLAPQIGSDVGMVGYPVPDDFEDEQLGVAPSLDRGVLSSLRKDALEVTLQVIPGDSGAPIFLADTGRVIGIADSRFDDEHAIGFAVPIDDALAFLHRYDSEHGF
jgi:S1-C subfamily serine protease